MIVTESLYVVFERIESGRCNNAYLAETPPSILRHRRALLINSAPRQGLIPWACPTLERQMETKGAQTPLTGAFTASAVSIPLRRRGDS